MAGFDYAGAIELFDEADSIVVCGHVNPDGDCLGSVLALTMALRARGRNAVPLLATASKPEVYSFLDGYDLMVPAREYKETPDLFVVVDVPNPERTGDGFAVFSRAKKSVQIDHHTPQKEFATKTYVDKDAPAAGVLIWELLKQMDCTSPSAAASCYVALMTDTGRFQFQNADARAFAAASEMVAAGASPSELATLVYQHRSRGALELQRLVIERMETFFDGRAVISWVEDEDFTKLEASRENDGDNLIDIIRELGSAEIAVMLRGQHGVVRGSIRSKNERDVAAIAEKLGGGGHRAAAGFTYHGTVAKARKRLLYLLKDEFASEPEPSADTGDQQ